MPGCEAPATCTADGCKIPACTSVGAPCDPDISDQGNFRCLSGSDDEGVCLAKCEDALEASTCPTGEYCWDLGPDGAPANVCISSDCQADSECTNGTCLNFDNDFGLCLTAGTTAIGASCTPSGNSCEVGAYCRTLDSASDIGVCSAFCDPFAAAPGCPGTEVCGPLFSTREALCTDDKTTVGSEPGYICDAAGSFCDDGVRCFPYTSSDSACLKYCRPGTSDCSAVIPDASGGVPSDGVCDNYVFPGERTYGVCFSPCASAADCGTSGVCVMQGESQGVCRDTCSVGSEAQDCCGGTTPCRFTCVNSLCE